MKTNFTHAKDQFAGLDLNAGFVEAFYEGFPVSGLIIFSDLFGVDTNQSIDFSLALV